MTEMFNILIEHKLSPNQFYVLHCIQESVDPPNVNMNAELRFLRADEWLTDENKLTEKSLELIQEIGSFFKIRKKATSKVILGDAYSKQIKKYREMFPKIKLPNGKYARSDEKNLENNFRWFFQNYDYSWEIVLKATEAYIEEYEAKQWEYMRTSQYFICKTQPDKSRLSDLADYCSIVESGDIDKPHHFSENVV